MRFQNSALVASAVSFLNSTALLSSQVECLVFFARQYTPRPDSKSLFEQVWVEHLNRCKTSNLTAGGARDAHWTGTNEDASVPSVISMGTLVDVPAYTHHRGWFCFQGFNSQRIAITIHVLSSVCVCVCVCTDKSNLNARMRS